MSVAAFRVCYISMIMLVVAVAGCGGQGPSRYSVAGQVTYRGAPVPGGRILFEPDSSAGNSGTGSVAEIVNGQYRTRDDKGTVGGPHVVTIFGTNGKTATETYDNSLFSPYRTTVEIPMEDATIDLVVPNDHS